MNVQALNRLPTDEARLALARCCGAERWVRGMLAARPFADEAALAAVSARLFASLTREDWLEAFSHHPKIGDLASLKARFGATADLASKEQAGTLAADEATLVALAAGNEAYERRFGHIFIICATGRSAREMLEALQQRLANDAATELAIAGGEQAKITALRLEKAFP